MSLVLDYFDLSKGALNKGASINNLVKLPVREAIGRFKYIHENDLDEQFKFVNEQLVDEIDEVVRKGGF